MTTLEQPWPSLPPAEFLGMLEKWGPDERLVVRIADEALDPTGQEFTKGEMLRRLDSSTKYIGGPLFDAFNLCEKAMLIEKVRPFNTTAKEPALWKAAPLAPRVVATDNALTGRILR